MISTLEGTQGGATAAAPANTRRAPNAGAGPEPPAAPSRSILDTGQAQEDIWLLKAAAQRASGPQQEERILKAASLYATGFKEFVTGQLREALLSEESGVPAVTLRGDPAAAEAARRSGQQQQPPPPGTPPGAPPGLPPSTPPPGQPGQPGGTPPPPPGQPGQGEPGTR